MSVEYTDKLGELAKCYGLKLHVDGARIFNASTVRPICLSLIHPLSSI